MIIAVTGMFGSGKTTVAKMFKEKGAFVIDADRIGWKVLEQKKGKIIKTFGICVLKNKKIDRNKLRELVFNNKKKLDKLNKLTHPEIIKEIRNKVKNNKKMLVIDVALYDKLKIKEMADKKIVVQTNTNVICERLLKKYKKEEILRILKTQKNAKKLDFKVNNNYSIKNTERQVGMIWQKIK